MGSGNSLDADYACILDNGYALEIHHYFRWRKLIRSRHAPLSFLVRVIGELYGLLDGLFTSASITACIAGFCGSAIPTNLGNSCWRKASIISFSVLSCGSGIVHHINSFTWGSDTTYNWLVFVSFISQFSGVSIPSSLILSAFSGGCLPPSSALPFGQKSLTTSKRRLVRFVGSSVGISIPFGLFWVLQRVFRVFFWTICGMFCAVSDVPIGSYSVSNSDNFLCWIDTSELIVVCFISVAVVSGLSISLT